MLFTLRAFFFVPILKKSLLFSSFNAFPIQYFELTVGIRPYTSETIIGYQEYDETGTEFGNINIKDINLPSGEIARIYYFESSIRAAASTKTDLLCYYISKGRNDELELIGYTTVKLTRLDSNRSIYISDNQTASIKYTKLNLRLEHFTNAFFNKTDISHTIPISIEFL